MFLVFLTTFGPHHFWSQTASCPNFFEPSLTPRNLGQWSCSSGQFHVLFIGPWTSLRETPLAQDHFVRDPPLCCVVCRCCVGVSVRCVFKIFVGASQIWAVPRLPSAGPPLPTPTPPPNPPPDRPKFLFFFTSRHNFHSFCFSWGVVLLNFGESFFPFLVIFVFPLLICYIFDWGEGNGFFGLFHVFWFS